MQAALVAYLTAYAGLTALIGTRLYPQAAPQRAARPYVVYTVVSRMRAKTLDGPDGVPMFRVQLDAWADTYLAAEAVVEQLRLALDGYHGAMGSKRVQACDLSDGFDLYDAPESGQGIGTYGISLDCVIYFEESQNAY